MLTTAPRAAGRGTAVGWDPGVQAPGVVFRGSRWEVDDALAAELAPGVVLKIEMVVRFVQLRHFKDGVRWETELLEVGRTFE